MASVGMRREEFVADVEALCEASFDVERVDFEELFESVAGREFRSSTSAVDVAAELARAQARGVAGT